MSLKVRRKITFVDFKKRFGDRTRIPTTKSNIKDSESSFGNLSVGSGEGKGVKFSSKKDL